MQQTASPAACATCGETEILFPTECFECLMAETGGNFAEAYQAACECDDIEIIGGSA